MSVIDLTQDGVSTAVTSAASASSSSDRNRHTNWCLTYSYGGPTQPPREAVDRFIDHAVSKAKYFVGGFESAPTTGQLHLQGYLQLKTRVRLSELKRWPEASSVHWEPARGDETQNRDYCLGLTPGKIPNEEYVEEGVITETDPGGREKKRWRQALDELVTGNYENIDPQIRICQAKQLDYLYDKLRPKPVDLAPGIKHLWYWGNTGSGKSRQARVHLRTNYPEGFYTKLHNKWWDHYEEGKPVLIDDLGLEVGKCLRDYLKQWLDMYVFSAEYKGGCREHRPPLFIITSNFHPWEIWGGTKDYDPIMRRLSLQWFGNPGEIEPQYDGELIHFPDTSFQTPQMATRTTMLRVDTSCPTTILSGSNQPHPTTTRPMLEKIDCEKFND